MGINKGERFELEDIFVSYPYEEVMYRWDHRSKKVFVRFYGASESSHTVPYDNRLFNEALCFGDEITQEEYLAGRPRR
ncbi:hypothetical protein [Pseudomonas sp. RIT-PI-S]|uniref:hypothetical protein n=1 Tax=Pseudomonas sp. RIT-PI-S TaxID=3035295 RepID=UPI0021DB25E7|nr:hypothetical protein [Pseudomonas sp. RIT-PI-S]